MEECRRDHRVAGIEPIGVRAQTQHQHVEIAKLSKPVTDPLELPTELIDLVSIHQGPNGAECRTQAPHGHAHVVHCVRLSALPNHRLGPIDLLKQAGECLPKPFRR